MLFNIEEKLVVGVCCDEAHRHTMEKTREPYHTIHDTSSAVRSAEHD